jgi:hypothetical protein
VIVAVIVSSVVIGAALFGLGYSCGVQDGHAGAARAEMRGLEPRK